MLRAAFLFIISVHALIHLLGFVKAWDIAPVQQLTGKTIIPLSGGGVRFFGALWLAACLLLLSAALMYLLKNPAWWIPGAAGVLLSQFIIIIYWPDARAGTLANIILLPVIITGWANWSFGKMAARETAAMFSESIPNQPQLVTPEMAASLPPPVARWLTASGATGKEKIYTVRLKQKGLMRQSPEKGWMKTQAVQYFSTGKPGFIWNARVEMMPLLTLAGRDKYADGKGNMLIKALGLLPVVDATGPEIDQGTMLRYLGEMIWFPSAALEPYIAWEPIDSVSAKATMNYGGVTASGVFTFDEEGRMLSFSAKRYMGGDEGSALEDWYIPASGWKEFNGIRVPSKGDVIWKLKDGDFNYYQWEIEAIEYNIPELYPH